MINFYFFINKMDNDDILFQILYYMKASDITLLNTTNKQINTILSNQHFWKAKYEYDFDVNVMYQEGIIWKKQYKHEFEIVKRRFFSMMKLKQITKDTNIYKILHQSSEINLYKNKPSFAYTIQLEGYFLFELIPDAFISERDIFGKNIAFKITLCVHLW